MVGIGHSLDDASLTVTGHALVSLGFEFASTILEDDGLTYHGMTRFHALPHTE